MDLGAVYGSRAIAAIEGCEHVNGGRKSGCMSKSEKSPYSDMSKNFGMTEKQADRDVDRGHAEPRNSAEVEAAKDYVEEAIDTGQDPIPSGKS